MTLGSIHNTFDSVNPLIVPAMKTFKWKGRVALGCGLIAIGVSANFYLKKKEVSLRGLVLFSLSMIGCMVFSISAFQAHLVVQSLQDERFLRFANNNQWDLKLYSNKLQFLTNIFSRVVGANLPT